MVIRYWKLFMKCFVILLKTNTSIMDEITIKRFLTLREIEDKLRNLSEEVDIQTNKMLMDIDNSEALEDIAEEVNRLNITLNETIDQYKKIIKRMIVDL